MRFALLFACLLAYIPSVQAQSLPAALMMRPSMIEPVDPELRLQPLDRDLMVAQRSRLLMATGIGMLTSATIHAGVFGNFGGCGRHGWPDTVSRREMLMAGAVGLIGASMTIGSGLRMARVPHETWRAATPGQKVAAVFTAWGTTSLMTAALTATWAKSDQCD